MRTRMYVRSITLEIITIARVQNTLLCVISVAKTSLTEQNNKHIMDNKASTFFTAVDSLVRISEDNQLQAEHYRDTMHPGAWLRDMSTVMTMVPRQVGKTSYIMSRARCADLIIVHNHAMKDQYQGSRAEVVSAPELSRFMRQFIGAKRGFNRVYVDEPRLVFTNGFTSDELYSFFCGEYRANTCANMFIMLGT